MGIKTISGKYSSAKIFTTNNNNAIEDYSIAQIQLLCDNETSFGSSIRVMPDVHPGKVCTIGLTMTITNKIMPNVVGIDIGCGMSVSEIKGKIKEFQKLDTIIRDKIPSGFKIRNEPHHLAEDFYFEELRCYKHINLDGAKKSLGSLGSGNHFIEVGESEDKKSYLVIHSGSRHLGAEVTEHYLREGQRTLKEKGENVPYELTFLEGKLLEDYLHDIQIVQKYASLNRKIMTKEICKGMKWKVQESIDCIHNYVDERYETLNVMGAAVLRKGAISALNNEQVVIPINMRDGIILGIGKGNVNWNCSAPHGSGRILKREDVKSKYTVSDYKRQMKGIYSSCIGKGTLDEAPFAYRSIEEIQDAINDTVEIKSIIKPLYNFKAERGIK